ncbi:MAG: MFS transporter [Clostridia bacterium]|nr:MFS transporter [Clostridia bacterium]
MTNKKNFWLVLVVFSLVGQVAWVVENMYFNVFIYEMFNASAEQISLMVALSAVSATVTTLFMGALSDKLGKRKVFMAGGYIAWGITILSFALIREDIIGSVFGLSSAVTSICITLVIIMDVVMTFFGSTANDAAFNAWLTDETDSTNRGKAEGVNAMMPLVAILVVFGGFMSFDLSVESSWTLIFVILGVLVIIIGALGFFFIEEKVEKVSENANYFANIFYGFRPKVIKENKMLYFCLIAFAIFGISIQIFMPYLILYYTESLKMDNYVLIMAPAIILASVFTLFYGRVYDKLGFEKSVFPALLTLIVGYILLYFFKSTALVFIGSLLMMCGYLAGMAVFGAVIRDNTPPKKAGMLQGLRIFAQVLIPGVIGPFIGASVLKNAEKIVNNDGTTSFIPNENIFLSALIVAIILVALLSVVFFFKNKKENSNV